MMMARNIFEDFICPVVPFAFIFYICLWYMKNALPLYRQYSRDGRYVQAKVISFEATKLGIKNSDKFFVDVTCTPPESDSQKNYKLSTCHGKAKRYGKVSECRVCFAEGDPIPVLDDEIKLWRRDIIVSGVGMAVCGTIILLLLFGLVETIMGH